jgi:hypothetical protein
MELVELRNTLTVVIASGGRRTQEHSPTKEVLEVLGTLLRELGHR